MMHACMHVDYYIDDGYDETAISQISVNACINQAAGQCSQICALSETNEDGYTCSCLEGYSLLRDDRTCTANGEDIPDYI